MSASSARHSETPRAFSALLTACGPPRDLVEGGRVARAPGGGEAVVSVSRGSRARAGFGSGDAPVALAVPRPHALQLGRRAVRAGAPRVRRRQASAPPARL